MYLVVQHISCVLQEVGNLMYLELQNCFIDERSLRRKVTITAPLEVNRKEQLNLSWFSVEWTIKKPRR
ncbi:MAG: hypothetical protein NHB32_12480 [Fischerella sp. CENA71]|nr:hypothetical protein [Fischerella sp. CENA71]